MIENNLCQSTSNLKFLVESCSNYVLIKLIMLVFVFQSKGQRVIAEHLRSEYDILESWVFRLVAIEMIKSLLLMQN